MLKFFLCFSFYGPILCCLVVRYFRSSDPWDSEIPTISVLEGPQRMTEGT